MKGKEGEENGEDKIILELLENKREECKTIMNPQPIIGINPMLSMYNMQAEVLNNMNQNPYFMASSAFNKVGHSLGHYSRNAQKLHGMNSEPIN